MILLVALQGQMTCPAPPEDKSGGKQWRKLSTSGSLSFSLKIEVLFKEGKSAINLSNSGNFAKFGPGPFIDVRPVGGPENYLC